MCFVLNGPSEIRDFTASSDISVVITMRQTMSISLLTGYLLREIQKANIAVPEEDESPLAPPPRQVLEIMVS